MNKEFVKKMILAEKYKCEALKELLPDALRKRADAFESDVFLLIKDVALEIVKEGIDKEAGKEPGRKVASKIDVDFS